MTDEKGADEVPSYMLDELHRCVLARHKTADFQLLDIIPVLWSGWEADNEAALIELPDGKRDVFILNRSIVSDHVKPDETMLRERLAEYREVTAQTEAFLNRLEGDDT